MLLIDAAHESGSRRKDFVDEDEDGLLRREFDTFADDVYELSDGEVCGNEIFLLVDSGNI